MKSKNTWSKKAHVKGFYVFCLISSLELNWMQVGFFSCFLLCSVVSLMLKLVSFMPTTDLLGDSLNLVLL